MPEDIKSTSNEFKNLMLAYGVDSKQTFYKDVMSFIASKRGGSSLRPANQEVHEKYIDDCLKDLQKVFIRKTKNNIKALKRGNVFDHLAEWRDLDPRDPELTIQVVDSAALRSMMDLIRSKKHGCY